MTSIVERIWAYDASLWTDSGEDQWLGWLDVVPRVRVHVDELNAFSEAATEQFHDCVLLGMGGSSLAPEVLRRTFNVESFHVLDTTHPEAIRRLERSVDLEQTLFLASSKSGSTIETRSHLEYFWERTGGRGAQFAAITDPGSELDDLAHERGFRAVFAGEPQIGGRYSALSMFGIVPAALMGVDLAHFLEVAATMTVACQGEDGNPGLELGLQLGEGWKEGRDKVCIDESPTGFGLWAEQLLAESTGKQGKGLVPAPGEPPDGPDRQRAELDLVSTPTTSPASSTAGSSRPPWRATCSGSTRSTSPTCRPRRTRRTRCWRRESRTSTRAARSTSCSRRRRRGATTSASRRSSTLPARTSWRRSSSAATRRGCVVTKGLGPRYLHSTGQLHKGGPDTGLFIQVVDETGDELPIPGRDFGFGRLIRSQAAGDFAALEERGRRVVRIRLEDI